MNQKRATASTLVIAIATIVIIVAIAQTSSSQGQLPGSSIIFTENVGQWDNQVKFRAVTGTATMWFVSEGSYFQFVRPVETDRSNHIFDNEMDGAECMLIRATIVGANNSASIIGESLLDYRSNFFLGNDQSRWKTDVSSFSSIVYSNVYPHIDLRYYGNGSQLEYDFIVSPGGDLNDIQIRYDGVESVTVNDNGELEIETSWGLLVEAAPYIYQVDDGLNVVISGGYRILSDGTFGFELDDDYNPDLPIVIDPVLTFSTYLGGELGDYGWGIEVDDNGNIYLTGATYSLEFPLEQPLQETYAGESDLYMTKMGPDGVLIYSTYFGGTNREESPRLALDDMGCAYVEGRTFSTDMPTVSAYDNELTGNSDIFVVKFSAAGDALLFSTYLGGAEDDMSAGIGVDPAYCVYVAGITTSQDFPVLNPYQISPSQGTKDITVTKFNPAGDGLEYSTYLGGVKDEEVRGFLVDDEGCAYVAGFTYSNAFPVYNAFDSTFGGYQDACLTKFTPEGNAVVFSTFLGGDLYNEWIDDIAIDDEKNVYCTGSTMSADFPLVNPFQSEFKGGTDVECDAFVSKFNPQGNALLYSTFIGGVEDDYGRGIDVDRYGVVHVVGYTYSYDWPVQDPLYPTMAGEPDAVFFTLSTAGNELLFSTYLGGSQGEIGRTVSVDATRNAHVTGYTLSEDFPLVNPIQTVRGGSRDAFVAIFENGCCHGIKGNVDYDDEDIISGLDVVYFVDWLFKYGSDPDCPDETDLDGNGQTDVSDLSYLVDYMWKGGPAPGDCGVQY